MHRSLLVSGELPELRDPLVVAAFWGWSDGTGTALGTVRYLRETWNATEVATVDPDRFYDLTAARPRQQWQDDKPVVRWPGTRFHIARPPGGERDVVLLAGREPSLAWREYAEVVADLMKSVESQRFLALGSRPAPVPHTRPSGVVLGDADGYFEELLGHASQPSRYAGPTGIQTVIALHLRDLGMSTGRLTALVPGYINAGPHPRAMLALIERLDAALGSSTPLDAVHAQIASFDSHVEAGMASSEESASLREQLRQLEEQYDSDASNQPAEELPTGDELFKGIADLLRNDRRDRDSRADDLD